MEIKYEAVFGDQSLFDGAGDGVLLVVSNGIYRKFYYYPENVMVIADTGGKFDIAMRRIIRTPTWTVTDQNAGKLPVVGCRVNFCHKLNTNWRTGEIKYIDDQVAVIKADDIDRPFVYEVDRVEFKPIETPEEKAQREEDEFVGSICRPNEPCSTLYIDGIRAAYRKLKGGE